jgi:hypothetical protein
MGKPYFPSETILVSNVTYKLMKTEAL